MQRMLVNLVLLASSIWSTLLDACVCVCVCVQVIEYMIAADSEAEKKKKKSLERKLGQLITHSITVEPL